MYYKFKQQLDGDVFTIWLHIQQQEMTTTEGGNYGEWRREKKIAQYQVCLCITKTSYYDGINNVSDARDQHSEIVPFVAK